MHGHFGERPRHVRLFELVETRALRRRMEAAIETLIATLDALDGESDLEAVNDDEPSLGWPSIGCGAAGRLDGPASDAGDDDRELDEVDDEDAGDREPCCEDEGAQCDDEGVPDLGIADRDGLLEVESAGAFGEWLL